ncbi:MAG: uracil phosphoribosyltransferase [Bacteroidetes bacterium]|nr:MAG: uracil phosphoribosyltransferase [Bacteroidota bacterium]
MIFELGKENSILNQFIAEMRDEEIQKDSMRFRRNLERAGEICAYEISKKLEWEKKEITTPLGVANASVLKQQPVIATILRAGLPFHRGMLNIFDKAENAFISAYRKHHPDGTFEVQVEYMACPDLNDKALILCDPMLASGQSIELVFKALKRNGIPKKIHIASLLASSEGVEYVKKHLPNNVILWVCAIDEELTSKAYIVPGLGDAGDLAFGNKL